LIAVGLEKVIVYIEADRSGHSSSYRMEMNECTLMNCSAKWTVPFICDCIVFLEMKCF